MLIYNSILYPPCRHTLGSAFSSFIYAYLRWTLKFESRLALSEKERTVSMIWFFLFFGAHPCSEGSKSRLPARSALNGLHRRPAPRLALCPRRDDKRKHSRSRGSKSSPLRSGWCRTGIHRMPRASRLPARSVPTSLISALLPRCSD